MRSSDGAMRLGMYIHELWREKRGLAIAIVVALLVATRVAYGISLLPPGVGGHSVEASSASTHVLVDTPRSTLLDLRQDVYEIPSLTQRALVLGNVMASPPVRDYIARRVGVPAESISATAPLTPEQPRAIAGTPNAPTASDILRPPDEYRLSIQANPTVPVLDVYTEAPNPEGARALADGAVEGLRDYLTSVAARRGTPADEQVKLEQLGDARSGVINGGAGFGLWLVVFAAALVVSSAAVLVFVRLRRGWEVAANLGNVTG